MASISTDPAGNRVIQFVGGDGKRRSVRLGKVNKKVAEAVKVRIETLNALLIAKLPMDGDTATWVAGVGDDLAAKLAAVGLIPERRTQALGAFLDGYLIDRAHAGKPATVVHLRTVTNDLARFFGATADLRAVTERGAEEYKAHLQARQLAAATVARRLKAARMLFGFAKRTRLIDANPFAGVSAPSFIPEGRNYYVSEADARRVIAECDPTWRVIVALARFGGLRCPSEVLSLKWEGVNFAAGRMTVPSPKTEHLPGKASREVPIFAALRPYLDGAFELASAGEEFVVGGAQGAGYRAAADTPAGWVNCNLRTRFRKIITRAGLTPWPRLFHNLRASCETDLMQHHPIHVVCAWLGNTPRVALGHYLQTLDRDFQKAIGGGAESGAVVVQNAVQSEAVAEGQEPTGPPETLTVEGFRRLVSDRDPLCINNLLGRAGVEPASNDL
jgi:integrase